MPRLGSIVVFFAQVTIVNAGTGASISTALPSEISTVSTDRQKQWQYFAYGMTIVSFIFLVLILWMRKTVAIAIEVIREASCKGIDLWGFGLR